MYNSILDKIVPSAFQEVILGDAKDTTWNLFVNAVAGSGKSATLQMIAELFYDKDSYEQDILACAFNSHIVKDLTPKMPPNTKVCTMHSLGFEAWRNHRAGSKVKVDQFKTGNVLAKFFDMNDSDSKARYFKWRNPIGKIISLIKAHGPSFLDQENRSSSLRKLVQPLIEEYDIKLPKLKHYEEDIFWNRLDETWAASLQMLDIIDFDDMIFFPVLHQVPVKRFRLALFDEFQDMNPVQIDFALMLNSRTIAVGDPKQSIYAFRGADIRAIQNYILRTKAKELPLSVCYRCAKAIVAEAKKYVPQIEAAPNAIEGKVERLKVRDYRKLLADGDYVLCRCTAPLVTECLAMIREGRKAMVKGRDIGQKLIELIEEISSKQATTEHFYHELMAYQSKKMVGLERANREIEIMQLTDRVDTLVVLLEDCDTVGEMIVRINSIFRDDKTVGITFCTVHKAKGLESKNIFIIEPDLMPHPQAKTESAQEQEKNIIYVAITRAKENLYWVDGKVSELKNKVEEIGTGKAEESCNCGTPLDGSHDHITCGPPVPTEEIPVKMIVEVPPKIEVLEESPVKDEVIERLREFTRRIPKLSQAKTNLDKVFEEENDGNVDTAAASMKKDIESGMNAQEALDKALRELSEME